MANKITVKFEAVGAEPLKHAINALADAQKRLNKNTKEFPGIAKKNNEAGAFALRNYRNQSKAIDGLNVRFSVLRSKLLLASFGVALLNKSIGSLVRAQGEQELSEKKLEQALGRTSIALLSQASALQQVSTFGDETIISAQALIAAFIDDEEQIKAATKATLDLAAAKGMDLSSAADLVSKTLGSSTNSLSRYGIEVRGTVGSTERLDSLTRSIADTFGGQAKSQADTLSGSILQMKNAMGDTSEVMGLALSPVIKSVANFLKEAAEGATEFIRGLTETPLESTIRQLESLGVEAESLIRLKDIQLNKEIRLLNEELKKVNKEGLSQEDIDSRLAEIAQERIDITMSLADIQSRMSENALDNLQSEVSGVRERFQRETNAMLFNEELREDHRAREKRERDTIQGMYDEFYKNQGEDEKNRLAQLEKEEELLLGVATVMAQILGLEIKVTNLKSGSEGQGNKNKLTEQEINLNLQLIESNNALSVIKEEMNEFEAEFLNIEAEKLAIQEKVNLGLMTEIESRIALNKAKAKEIQTNKALVKSQLDSSQRIMSIGAKVAENLFQNSQAAKALMIAEMSVQAFKTAINTRELLSKHFPPPIPGIAAAAEFAATMVMANKAEKFEAGGLVGGRRHSQGGTMIEAEQGEFVMNRNAVDAIGVGVLDAMNEGGGSAITVNISGNVMSDSFVEDELAEKIANAVRRGVDFGMS